LAKYAATEGARYGLPSPAVEAPKTAVNYYRWRKEYGGMEVDQL
jgi:hypothetical protein